MGEKLTVKDFGPISSATLDIKKITVLIGPQGSGKSTLAKLLAIFNNPNFLVDAYIGKKVEDYFSRFQIQYFLNSSSSFEYSSNNFQAKFKVNDFSFQIAEEEDFLETSAKSYFPSLQSLKNEWLRYNERVQRGTSIMNTILTSIVLPSLLKKTTSLTHQTKYLPTDRIFISSISDSILGLLTANIALQKSTIEFGNYFEIARTHVSNLPIEYLNIAYKYENGRNLIYYNEQDSVPLSASASGHQSSIPLHVTIEHFSKEGDNLFIVEEPELNLFPITQKNLIQFLIEKCGDNNRLVITTHSPYVLSTINNLLFAYQTAKAIPDKEAELASIIPKSQWINPKDFSAYYVGEDKEGNKGGVKSIFNEKTGLISENELDEISDSLGDDFDSIMQIYKMRNRER